MNALPENIRPVVLRIFRSFLNDLRFGHPSTDEPETLANFGGAFLHATTPSTPGDTFSIAHGLGRTPYLAIPCLLLDTVGSSWGPLTVQRAADDRRIYLTSTEGDLSISLITEG